MSTLATLKATCAAYHHVAVGDLTVSGTDLFLIAANNARRAGELLHNFELARVTATLDIDGETGGDLGDAVIALSVVGDFQVEGDPSTIWIRAGTWAAHPLYIKDETTPASFLYFNTELNSYLIADVLDEAAPADGAVLTPDGTNPAGSYIGFGEGFGSNVDLEATATAPFSAVKEIQNVQRLNTDGTLEPLDFCPSEVSIERTRTEIEFSDELWYENRYPSDRQRLYTAGEGTIVQRNNSLFIYPVISNNTSGALSVRLEGYGWLRDYIAGDLNLSDPVDFFVQYGYAYLQWSIIIELNLYFKTFVPRSEGNLGAPSDQQQVAWRNLLLWDSYKVNANLTRSR